MQKLYIFPAILVIFVIFSCEKNTPEVDYLSQADCSGVDFATNTYTNNIKDIMDTYCALSGCHNASSREAGVDLSTYAKTKNAFETTSCLCSIHHGGGCSPMPKGGAKLSDATIKLIDCWAKNGYQE